MCGVEGSALHLRPSSPVPVVSRLVACVAGLAGGDMTACVCPCGTPFECIPGTPGCVRTKRVAYADPPYPGQSKKHYGDHPDYAGEVDHAELIDSLSGFDGWALSTNSKSLQSVLALCPADVRVLVWVKRSAPPFPKHGIYGWEPVILKWARPPEEPLRDWLICEPEMFTFRPKPASHVVGQKPPPFCQWVFRWLGVRPDDELVDLFPGSGAVGHAWDAWRRQPNLLSQGAA